MRGLPGPALPGLARRPARGVPGRVRCLLRRVPCHRPAPRRRRGARALRAALADAGPAPGDVDHVNAHGTATPQGDAAEHNALHQVFARVPPVTAGKGAIEAACTVLSLRHQLVPPTANLDVLDPALDLDVVTKVPRAHRMRAAVSNSFGFGGQNAVLAFTTAD